MNTLIQMRLQKQIYHRTPIVQTVLIWWMRSWSCEWSWVVLTKAKRKWRRTLRSHQHSTRSIRTVWRSDTWRGWFSVSRISCRSASMTSSDILESLNEQGDKSYLEEIVRQCCYPLPNPFFASQEFVSQYLFLCDEMCKWLIRSLRSRSHIISRASSFTTTIAFVRLRRCSWKQDRSPCFC